MAAYNKYHCNKCTSDVFLRRGQPIFITEPVHDIFNNVVCATSKASDQPAHTRSLIRAFASRLSILNCLQLTEHRLAFLSLKGSCIGSSESTLVKCQIVGNFMPRLNLLSDTAETSDVLVHRHLAIFVYVNVIMHKGKK